MFKKNVQEIIFTAIDEYWDNSPYKPVPAKNEIPQWYKDSNTYVNNVKQITFSDKTEATIKKCMPIFDAITSGYIIKLTCDIYIKRENDEILFNWAEGPGLDFHPIQQAPLYPNVMGERIPKWINPWIIQTPPGYSVLIINPLHRKDSPISILEGVVDTDKFNTAINFPFQVNDTNFTGFVPAGTPIAQIIPFKRDSWKHSFGGDIERKNGEDSLKKIRHVFYDGYKRFFRSSKEFN